MAGTFLFYDIETTGLNKSFDQILSFAAIRTDAALRELDRETIRIRLRPDVIPHPEALITHRLSIAETQSGLCEYEAVRRIHQMFNTPNTISIGYNTLGFDDEFLRFAFYRNLLPPYRHQYENGCFRMDVYPMTLIYWLFHRDGIAWPEIDGKPSLKLEALNAANGWITGRAHDAMNDVAATLSLADRLRAAPQMWSYLHGCFDKRTDKGRIALIPAASEPSLAGMRLGILVDGRFGADRAYLAPALAVGTSIPYANQEIWLRLDTPELAQTTESCIAETTRVVRKRHGEPPIVLPPRERFLNRLTPACREVMDASIHWISEHPDIFRETIQYHRAYRYPEVPDVDLDAALYVNKFMSAAEERRCGRFHAADPSEKTRLLSQFENGPIRDLAVRLMWRNYPEALPQEMAGEMTSFCDRVNPATEAGAMVDFRGERRGTPTSIRLEICRLRAEREMDSEQTRLLSELEAYLADRFPERP